jgi:hypothetical protein
LTLDVDGFDLSDEVEGRPVKMSSDTGEPTPPPTSNVSLAEKVPRSLV